MASDKEIRRRAGLTIAAGLAGLLFFRCMWQLGLNCDDYMYWAFSDSGKPWVTLPGGRSRPLTTWLLVGFTARSDEWPWLLPAFRLAHHGLNAWLVGAVARYALRWNHLWAAVAAVAFLVWGSHGEVYYFSAMHDLAAATGVLLGIMAACRVASPALSTGLVAMAAVFAYMSKESAWPLPIILAVLPVPHSLTRAGRRRAATAAAGVWAGMMALRGVSVGLRGELETGIYHDVTWQRGAASLSKLLFRSWLPGVVDVNDWVPFLQGHVAWLLAPALLLVAWAGVTCWRLGDGLYRTSGARIAICYLAALVPVCMLSVSVSTSENSRYLYLPTVFTVLLFTAALRTLQQRWPQAAVAALGSTCILAQAGSLWLDGQRWVRASQLTRDYRAALETLLDQRGASDEPLALACVPDSFRGALAARNISTYVVERGGGPSPVLVLATQYINDVAPSGGGCVLSASQHTLNLRSSNGRPSLTHPSFYNPGHANQMAPFKLAAKDLTHDLLTAEVEVAVNGAGRPWTVAVYNGHGFDTATLQ